jgi:phosphoethanolamine N-methyltransferase
VLGIDVDPVLLTQMDARIARAQLADRIKSLCVTPGPLPFESASFDVVFSKDAIVHIPDKAALYADIHRILRPGGRFIASDWLRGGTGAYSAEMMEYFRLEGVTYNMATLDQCAAAVKRAGFVNVEVRDRNEWYFGLAQRELDSMEGKLKPVIVERIGAERAEHFVANWRQLVLVLRRGELRPGHLKPPSRRRSRRRQAHERERDTGFRAGTAGGRDARAMFPGGGDRGIRPAVDGDRGPLARP